MSEPMGDIFNLKYHRLLTRSQKHCLMIGEGKLIVILEISSDLYYLMILEHTNDLFWYLQILGSSWSLLFQIFIFSLFLCFKPGILNNLLYFFKKNPYLFNVSISIQYLLALRNFEKKLLFPRPGIGGPFYLGVVFIG